MSDWYSSLIFSDIWLCLVDAGDGIFRTITTLFWIVCISKFQSHTLRFVDLVRSSEVLVKDWRIYSPKPELRSASVPLFWCLHVLWRSIRGSTRWTVFGYPPIPDGGGRHRWAGKGRSGGSWNICSRGIHAHRQLQVEETHEEETSIPQVGWSWTIPRLDPELIDLYQLPAI